jgi:ribosomal protein S18 acetylase RimI-like enzyme
MSATSSVTSSKRSTAPDLTVRPIQRGDHSRVAEIFVIARRHAFPWIPPERFRLSDLKRETEGEAILVAEQEGRIVGFAAVWEPDSFLHHLYIDPAIHRRGIGRALMEALARTCEKPIELKCQINNKPAMAFYRRLGFTTHDSGISDIGPWVRWRAPPAR